MLVVRRFCPVVLVAVLALAAFALPVNAQPANLPTWTVGQAVGYGTNLDLTSLMAPLLLQLQSNPAAFNITSIQELNFTGSLDVWVHDEVVSQTDTYYVLQSESANGLKIHVAVNVTFNNLPAPGTYSGSCTYGFFDGAIPAVTRSVEVDMDLTSLSTTSGTARYAVSDLALMEETSNATDQVSGRVILRGVPMIDLNLTLCPETVTYDDPDLTIAVNMNNEYRVLFSPALDYFDFPINPSEDWWVYSNATVGATLSGTINVDGLDAADEAAFFDSLASAFQSISGLAITGLDHFPIDLAQITVTVGGTNVLQGGLLRDMVVPVAERLQAREANMTLADGDLHPVMLLSAYQDPLAGCPPTLYAVYSVDDGMIVGLELYPTCEPTGLAIFELRPVPADTAQEKIGNTERNYAVVPTPAGNPVADFFFAAPYWGLLLVILAIAIIALLLLRRRGRPTIMSPPAPPMPPPPPPSPP
jgi:hypothetical protein